MATLTTIQIFFNSTEAVVAKSLLEAHGIFAVLPEWHHATNAWHLTFALQGFRLCILDRDREIASKLLEVSPGYIEPEPQASTGSALLALFCIFLAVVPYPVRQRKPPD